ncbi:Uncharacterized membrane protein YdjX, TVP38/TMEM64 family, SNARE-associated domain [Natronincola peptidivorans]|uniref:TVP38/TMEM64 family membrane protein n=1 Tax=Natronincola peptidivorans TaxID=426128 RepID=A0A1I0H713_9FIRM|nr:TVP38/TMEM64 family protein [Natronincola peptidivorans]SET79547.1 Uncharacterized membrane protein YdjX, TVP38/TMEM64 family, SNARE-associated domain [Natronincola peptidivorans]
MKHRSQKLILFILFILGVFLLLFFSMRDHLTIENIHENRVLFQNYVRQHYLLSIFLYIAIYTLVVASGIPAAIILSLLGGALFGVLPAALFINLSATIGAAITFLLSRYYIGSWVQSKYKDRLSKFNAEVKSNGHYYMIFVRLVPVFPFIVVNSLSGLTKISFRVFLWTTALGVIPISVIYAYTGSNLAEITSPQDILSTGNIIVFSLLALLALLPIFIKKMKNKNS